MTFKITPVAAWNNARILATGNPHPARLPTGLAEPILQLRRVRHRERRAVDEQGAMAAPEPLGLSVRDQGHNHIAKHGLQDGARQAGSREAVGGAGERPSGEPATWHSEVLP